MTINGVEIPRQINSSFGVYLWYFYRTVETNGIEIKMEMRIKADSPTEKIKKVVELLMKDPSRN